MIVSYVSFGALEEGFWAASAEDRPTYNQQKYQMPVKRDIVDPDGNVNERTKDNETL